MVIVRNDRLDWLENNPLSVSDLGLGILHRDFDMGVDDVFPKVNYKCPVDLHTRLAPDKLGIFHLNCQGLNSTLDYLSELCMLSDFHILALTETWLMNNNSGLLDILNYNMYVKNRTHHQHGGLALYIRTDLNVKVRDDLSVNKEMVFECFVTEVDKNGDPFFIAVCYRPPSASVDCFLELLEQQMDLLTRKNMPCFVCGDFNIDLKLLASNLKARNFLNLMLGYGMHPAVNICTRVTESSSSLIDNVFLNVPHDSSSVVLNDVSDHFGLAILVPGIFKNININCDARPKPKKLLVDSNTISRFKLRIEQLDFKFLQEELDLNLKFELWYGKIKDTFLECCEVSGIQKRRVSPNKPWITKSLLQSINRRRFLYKLSTRSNDPHDKVIYRVYNSRLNAALRLAKVEYYKVKFKKVEGNPSKTWKLIKSVTCPGSVLIRPDNMGMNNNVADEMCNHFATIGQRVSSSVPVFDQDGDFRQFLPEDCDVSAYLKSVTIDELFDVINNMKNGASGGDFISLKVLKSILPVISSHFLGLINNCLKAGIFPDCLKCANVIPIFKGGDKNCFSDYRPISLLPFISRVFEKLIHSRMVSFFEKRQFFSSSQFGFRSHHSTEHGVLFLTTFINDALDKGLKIASIFLDITKAFDSVDHDILVQKLYSSGIRGDFLNVIVSFLSGRTQCVVMDGVTSKIEYISIGVPQGSVLGPLLFLVYINDLCRASSNVSCSLDLDTYGTKGILPCFADDAHFTVAARTENELMTILKQGISSIEKWMRVNKLKLNHNKSNFLIYGRITGHYPWINSIEVGHHTIVRSTSTRYLGVIIDESLSFKDHIASVNSKLSRNIGIMRKLRYLFPCEILRMLYFSMVHPYLIYCCMVWSKTFVTHLHPLCVTQNMAIRVLYGNQIDLSVSVRHLYREYKILPLAGICVFYNALFMFKYLASELPSCFSGMFSLASTTHDHLTRSSQLVRRPAMVTSRSRFSIRHVVPLVWESLPEDLRNVGGLQDFRKSLKNHCFDVYILNGLFHAT